MNPLSRWARGVLLLSLLGLASPLLAASTLVIAPGAPGQRLDRRLLAALSDGVEAVQGSGSLEIAYLRGGEVSSDELWRSLHQAGGIDPDRVILLHDPAVGAYRHLVEAGRMPLAEGHLVAYGVFAPAHRRWLRQQRIAHLDLLPVLQRGLAWIRHGSEARRLVGWITPESPLEDLESVLGQGEGRLDAVALLGEAAPGARPDTQQVLLALPGLPQRQQAAALLAEAPGAWCLMPEWIGDGCIGGVQPDPAAVARRLLALLDQGGWATAPAAPRLVYDARHRLREGMRDEVRYLGVPPGEADRRHRGERLLLGALGVAGVALLAFGLAWAIEQRRRRGRRRFGLDELTGMPGRPRLERRLQRYLDSGHAFQLCWIDVDRLEGVRESLGCEGYEEALRRIAKRLRRTARGEGYVARLEGEMFAVMSFLPAGEKGRVPVAMAFAQRLQACLSDPLPVGQEDRLVQPCIGIACSAPDKTPFDVLEEARAAARQVMRSADRQPRMLVHEDVAPDERCLALTELLGRLSPGELADQLSLSLEPRFLLVDRRPCGGEVHVRWHSPRWGTVEQDELVRLAEGAGHRALLDRLVCRRVVDELAGGAMPEEDPEGPRSGRTLWTIPVGLSQLVDGGVIESLLAACEEQGLASSRLELQFRGEELHDTERLQPALRRCREAGVGVAIQAPTRSGRALDAIFRLPVSRLVLEPALVARIPHDQSAILILKSLRDMAKLAGRHITVTGVTTSDQLVAVRGMNFVSAQGRLLGPARPLSAPAEPTSSTAAAVMSTEPS
ncbi:EAL domain-containing protein [Halomonas organivorans]